jgi:septal ring factor EnvC (AmiA/AmiB activator)
MSIRFALPSLVCAFLAATLLSGCQDQSAAQLKTCQDDKALLTQRIKEYKQVVEMKEKEKAEIESSVAGITAQLAQRDGVIASLKQENERLRAELANTPENARRLVQGAHELRQLQIQAVKKLQQQPDANKPK